MRGPYSPHWAYCEMSGEIFDCHKSGARDAVKRPTVHGKPTGIKNHSAVNVKSFSLRNPRKHEIQGYAFKASDNSIRQDMIDEQSRPS